MYLLYLLEHPLGVGNAGGLLAAVPGPAGEVVAGGELVHGDHGGAGLLPAQLQHREQVQRHRAHVGQGPHLGSKQLHGGLQLQISHALQHRFYSPPSQVIHFPLVNQSWRRRRED